MARIAARRLVRAKIAAFAHGFLILAAVISFVPAYQYVVARGASSGFFEYLSLIVSDGSAVLGYWKEFALTIAESVPLLGIGSIIGLIMVVAYSVKKVVEDIGAVRAYQA